MTLTELLLWSALVLIGIGGSAMCSGLEVGLYSTNRVLVRVHSAREKSKRYRMLQRQLDEPVPSLTSLLVWNNIFNYAGTLAITTLFATLGMSDTELILVQVAVLTPLLLVFAESTPKEVFRANADVLMPRFAIVLFVFRRMLTLVPIVPLLGWVADGASRLVGVGKLGSLGDARERVAELLKYGSGSMSDAQVTLIDRALQIGHAKVRNEMIPLRRTSMLRSGWTIARARAYVKQHPHSRFPVLGASGQIIGIVHAIEMYVHEEAKPENTIETIMHEPVFLTPEHSVDQALRALSRSGEHMGIVRHRSRDLGIVTRKDLVEPLVGELEEW